MDDKLIWTIVIVLLGELVGAGDRTAAGGAGGGTAAVPRAHPAATCGR